MINTLTFKAFIMANNRYKKLENVTGAKEVYEFLLKEENIDVMIIANNNRRAVLYGVQKELETKFDGDSDFRFQDNFIKQAVGAMTKHVLEPFGYIARQRELPKDESKYFRSAKHYDFDSSKAEYDLVKKLEIKKKA